MQVLELGASIIHGANEYMLSLAEEMGLTLDSGDDTGAAFNIWDGKDFVFSQVTPCWFGLVCEILHGACLPLSNDVSPTWCSKGAPGFG